LKLFSFVIQGLCGTFKINAADDMMTRWGLIAANSEEFAASWQLTPNCGTTPPPIGFCRSNAEQLNLVKQQCELLKTTIGYGTRKLTKFHRCLISNKNTLIPNKCELGNL
jgi:hypothetical protein